MTYLEELLRGLEVQLEVCLEQCLARSRYTESVCYQCCCCLQTDGLCPIGGWLMEEGW